MKQNQTQLSSSSGETAHGDVPPVQHEQISRRAYELWQQEGCTPGREMEHWLQAERQVLGANPAQGEPAQTTLPLASVRTPRGTMSNVSITSPEGNGKAPEPGMEKAVKSRRQ